MTFDPMQPWNADRCAEYLGVSKSHFLQNIRFAEGFPAELPPYSYSKSGKDHKSQPEWAGIDVMTWRMGPERITRYLRETAVTQ